MQAQTQQVTFGIRGMGCTGCASEIEATLKQTPGVRSARVSFPRAEALVEYDPAATAPQSLSALLSEAGYAATEAPAVDADAR